MAVVFETYSAELASDFGLKWATDLFGEEAIASLPVRAAGKNKGKPKGFVIWRKAITAGYDRGTQQAYAAGNMVDAWIGAGMFSTRGNAVQGKWLGRVQPLAASNSAGCFFEKGRERAAQERAESLARYAEDFTSI